jgi:glucokinase
VTELIAIDVGGTHARFARAVITDGAIELGEPVTLKTSDFDGIEGAWDAYAAQVDGPLPDAAAIAIAGPVTGETVRMTNNSWILHTGALDEQLGVEKVTVLNDFGAVAHAVARAPESELIHIAGPGLPLPESGTVSVIGPGTGLGVAHFHRFPGGYHVQATEGGHVDFAPIDAVDDRLLERLRERHPRVSLERVVSGPGIVEILAVLGEAEGRHVAELEDKAIWQLGLSGEDALCVAAVERFCLSLGSVCGDYALAHGASAVVLAGGLGLKLKDILPRSGFAERFLFKGRYERMMQGIPILMIVHPQPGLFGAAAAFAREHL